MRSHVVDVPPYGATSVIIKKIKDSPVGVKIQADDPIFP
jgi:hypothetical protein